MTGTLLGTRDRELSKRTKELEGASLISLIKAFYRQSVRVLSAVRVAALNKIK